MNSKDCNRLDYVALQCDARGLSKTDKRKVMLAAVMYPDAKRFTLRRSNYLTKQQIAQLYGRTTRSGHAWGTTAIGLLPRK